MADINHETLTLLRSFDLSARVTQAPDFSKRPDGTPRDRLHTIASHIEWQFCSALKELFRLTNTDLMRYTASFPEVGNLDDLVRIDLAVPDPAKLSIETMRGVYDSMDRFTKRLCDEAVCRDYLYAEDDYACGKQVHLYHRPQDMIAALNSLTHKKYRGNEGVLSHLYMARHMLEQMDMLQEQSLKYGPDIRLN